MRNINPDMLLLLIMIFVATVLVAMAAVAINTERSVTAVISILMALGILYFVSTAIKGVAL